MTSRQSRLLSTGPQSCWSFWFPPVYPFFSSFSFSFFLSFAFAFAFFGAGVAASAAAAPSAPGSDSLRFERRVILSARVSRRFSAERAGRTQGCDYSVLRWAGDCRSRGRRRNASAEKRRDVLARRRENFAWADDWGIGARYVGWFLRLGVALNVSPNRAKLNRGSPWRTRREIQTQGTKKLRMQIGDVSALRCSRVRRAGGCPGSRFERGAADRAPPSSSRRGRGAPVARGAGAGAREREGFGGRRGARRGRGCGRGAGRAPSGETAEGATRAPGAVRVEADSRGAEAGPGQRAVGEACRRSDAGNVC